MRKLSIAFLNTLPLAILFFCYIGNIHSQEKPKQFKVVIFQEEPKISGLAMDGLLASASIDMEELDLKLLQIENDSCGTEILLPSALEKAGYNVTKITLKKGQTIKDVDTGMDYDIRIVTYRDLYEHKKYKRNYFDKPPLKLDITVHYNVSVLSSKKKESFVKKIHHEEPSDFIKNEKQKAAQKKTAKELLSQTRDIIQNIVSWLNENTK